MSTTTTFNKKPLVLAVGTALAGASPIVAAQSAGSDGKIEEIIVTAAVRETSVQDIPYNISAMSGESMERQNIVNQYDVLRAMHGITVVDRGYRNAGTVNSIVIRGLNVDSGLNGDIMLNAVPSVATYYDNSPMYANFLVKDIERVEVLRGPQGTLYGSGSLGGTVRYIGRRPDATGFEADLEVDYSQTSCSDGNNLSFDGMINIPLGESTAIRALYSRIDNDGMIDYVNAYQLNAAGEPLIDVNGTCTDPGSATDAQILQNVACFKESRMPIRLRSTMPESLYAATSAIRSACNWRTRCRTTRLVHAAQRRWATTTSRPARACIFRTAVMTAARSCWSRRSEPQS